MYIEKMQYFTFNFQVTHGTLGHLNYYSDLNNFDNIFGVIEKVPYDLKRHGLLLILGKNGQEAGFSDLVHFVKQQV